MRSQISLLVLAAALPCLGQRSAIERYMESADVRAVASQGMDARTERDVAGILPLRQSQRFAEYVAAKSAVVNLAAVREAVEKLRLNKLVGSPAGGSGTTALLSGVAVPGLIGLATEYGGILQSSNGNVTTLRANLLGVTKMMFGAEQFPYCPEIDEKNCQTSSRWLRRFSGAISFGSAGEKKEAVTAGVGGAAPVAADLFGNEFRMTSWGLRFDLTANDPEDPKFVPAWRGVVAKLRESQEAVNLTQAVSELFEEAVNSAVYEKWAAETVPLVKGARAGEFAQILETQLDTLILRMAAVDAKFGARVAAVRRSFANYAGVRDDLLKEIQSHRASVEYTNLHPVNQPFRSNLRWIYSHQPTASPTLVTANVGFSWYHQMPAGVAASRMRDFQLAGQIDRRLGEIPNLGNAVLTVGAYYQWMKDDALIVIGPGNVAPGSGIILPGTAATLLGTKGHIGIVQGKVTIPVSGVVKIPISITWSNRTELIKEKDLRGQVGLTLDLDSLFKQQSSKRLAMP